MSEQRLTITPGAGVQLSNDFIGGFALGKRLAEAHIGHFDHFGLLVPSDCDYDLDSLQPDGWHLIQTDQTITTDGLTTRLTAAVQTKRVKCAGAVE